MKTRSLSILFACMATSVAIAGCSPTPASPPPPTATTPAPQDSDPWPGVPAYRDSDKSIVTRAGETFSIVLPPAPLFGWGWQNSDSSAFSLLETGTVPGPDDEPNPYGPNAFLFKALETGTFQITLYVASKPPQQLETFDIVVNP